MYYYPQYRGRIWKQNRVWYWKVSREFDGNVVMAGGAPNFRQAFDRGLWVAKVLNRLAETA